jgi:hypothetical protein
LIPVLCKCIGFTSYFSQVGDIVDVFGELKDKPDENAGNCVVISFLDVKDDIMFEIERSLEIEYLYSNVYFPNILAAQSGPSSMIYSSNSLVGEAPMIDENLAATDLSRRILSILSTEKTGIPLATFYCKLSDVDRCLVEEQVSSLTLDGLIYTNQGKLNLL